MLFIYLFVHSFFNLTRVYAVEKLNFFRTIELKIKIEYDM